MDLLNCFSNLILCSLLTTQFSHIGFGEEILTIIRNPAEKLWNNLDNFKVPDSKCSTPSYCAAYHVHSANSGKCKCKCSYHQSATFGFYSGSWTCLANTEVRKQTGCKYLFQSEPDETYPLKILETDRWYDTKELPSTGCSVDLTTSKYFKCDGTWTGIYSQSPASSWFSIQSGLNNPTSYKVKIGSGISDSMLGRIISLSITCDGEEPSCLLFKVQGILECNENVTSTPTRTPPTTSQISSRKIVTSDPTLVTSSVTTNPNDSAKNDKTKESGGSSTAVGVVVTMVIIVAIVIANIAYVYWKRKRGESVWLVDQILLRVRKYKSSPPKKTEDKTFEDPEYAEIPEEQRRNGPVDQPGDIYSYAFDDPHTAYGTSQPAPYNKLVHNKQGADQDGALYSTADDGPAYNVLERPLSDDEVIIMTGKTSGNTVNGGHLSEDPDQIYHTLEEPDATDETTDTRNDGHDVRASTGTANPSGRLNERVAPKVRRTPPSPPRKI